MMNTKYGQITLKQYNLIGVYFNLERLGCNAACEYGIDSAQATEYITKCTSVLDELESTGFDTIVLA